jgi:hypothetical protein
MPYALCPVVPNLFETRLNHLLITNSQLSEKIDRPKTVNFPYNFDNRVQWR